MTDIKTLGAYQPYIQELTKGTVTASGTKERITAKYSDLFTRYALNTPNGIFIKDPSQNNQIVSEGQAYWQVLAAGLARIDTPNARRYQDDFDGILKGTQYMIQLAKNSGNRGEFPAWKVRQSGRSVALDSISGSANSAADSDLDIVRSLVYAQELVDSGIWADRGYDKLLDKLIPAAQRLFRDRGGLRVLLPSEDWSDFSFTDYLDPAGYKEIAAYLTAHNKNADFWEKAASDSMRLYGEILNDTGTFPAHITVNTRGNISPNYSGWIPEIDVKTANNTTMTYDGIRSPWRIARYIIMFAETNMEARAAREALAMGKNYNFSHTSRELDAAMYLPLSVALGDTSAADLSDKVFRGNIPRDKYYENTMELLGLVDTVFPRQVNISNTSVPVATTPQTPVVATPAVVPAGKTAVTLPSRISSGWNKNVTYNVTSPNILTVTGRQANDNDQITLRNIQRNSATELVIKLRSRNNNFPWGGKIFGIALNGQSVEPNGRYNAGDGSGFIEGSITVGEELVFPLNNIGNNFNIDMKLYSGGNFEVEFWLK